MTKIIFIVAAVFLFFDGASPLFYGSNPALEMQTKKLSESIMKCQKAVESVNSNICKTIKTTLKFDMERYKGAAKSLIDLEYLFADIQGFYSNFLNCLNDQKETTTAVTTIRNLEVLVFQLDMYVITGIEQKLASAAEVLGQVFGEKTQNVISQISETLRDEFTKIKGNIEVIKSSFQAIADSGTEVTVESINATLSGSSFTEMLASFTLIETTSKQASEVFTNFVGVTATLEKITSSVQATKSMSTKMVSKSDYTLDITVQAAKKMFSNTTLKLESDVTDSFAQFYSVAALQFTGDADVQKSRTDVENLVTSITSEFSSLSTKFSTLFTTSFTELTERIANLQVIVLTSTKQVTDFLAEAVADNSGSYSKCLGPDGKNSKMSTDLIEKLGLTSALCIAQQTNVSMIAQSLLKFIGEDVVLNLNGTADALCGCAVKGDKKVEERSKKCFEKGVTNMTMQVDEEKMYLSEEFAKIEEAVSMSGVMFLECTENVTKIFDADFDQFQTAVKACTAV